MSGAPKIHPVEKLWREVGLPEYFLGNGGTNHKLYALYDAIVMSSAQDLIADWISEGTDDLPDETPVRIDIGGRVIVSDKLSSLRAVSSAAESLLSLKTEMEAMAKALERIAYLSELHATDDWSYVQREIVHEAANEALAAYRNSERGER